MDVFGSTRSRVTSKYALVTPDTHVSSPLIGWQNTTAIYHISPALDSKFVQYTAHMEADGRSAMPFKEVQRFFYVASGECQIDIGTSDSQSSIEPASHTLGEGGFAYLPAGVAHRIDCKSNAVLIVFEKYYQESPDGDVPDPVVGNMAKVQGEPFMGDADAVLQTLLPVTEAFDMAVNIFTYQSGATLPQVEIHVMEHGLLMLSGQGVYRLVDDYYPVKAGDVIWMAPYCPQWFVAMGKTPASYIYYKDIHRDPLSPPA